MLHDFYPVIFEEPSIFDAYTTDEIIEEVTKGQELLKQLIESPQSRVFGHSISDESEENTAAICNLMSDFIEKIEKYNS
jgi:hypothetical protein